MRDSDLRKDTIGREVNSRRGLLIEVSKFIHSHPEPNFQEKESAHFLVETLRKAGLTVEFPFCGVPTAFRATIGEKTESPHVAILAEFDALAVAMHDGSSPILHACGHNLNCSAAIGAILALQSISSDLHGTVSIIGTPAEEGGGGKVVLLNAGAFENIDAILTVHGDQRDWYTVARACSTGEFLEVSFTGRPSSAGYSKNYVNANDAVILFMNVLNVMDYKLTPDSLIQRRIVADTHGVNTIPLEMRVDIQIRSGDAEFLEKMRDCVVAAAEGVAHAIGASSKVETKGIRYERIIENKTLEEVAKSDIEYYGHHFRYDEPSPYPFGTDTGNLSHEIPTVQFLIGRPEGFKFHTPDGVEESITDSAHEMMIESAKILAATALDILSTPEILDLAKKELEEYRKSDFAGLYTWHHKM